MGREQQRSRRVSLWEWTPTLLEVFLLLVLHLQVVERVTTTQTQAKSVFIEAFSVAIGTHALQQCRFTSRSIPVTVTSPLSSPACSSHGMLLLASSSSSSPETETSTVTIVEDQTIESDDESESTTTSSTTSSKRRFRLIRRVRDSLLSRPRSRKELKVGIAGFYDRSSKLWEKTWGNHMHHGYYIPENRTDHVQAQIDMIDEVLKWADTVDEKVTSVVDVGCGIGGSSRHIAQKYKNCTTEGITLSPYQAQRATELTHEEGLDGRCTFRVADALDMPFEDNSFDLVWSLESGEHMPDKKEFVNELVRVATPGGRIILVTWCHRDLEDGEQSLTKKEQKLLAKINRAYYLPEWCSVQDYVDILEAKGITDVKRDDWSYIIAPFWKAVIRSALSFKSFVGLARSGPSTIRGAWAMFLMLRGFNKGLIKFGLITCTKPSSLLTADEDTTDKGNN